MCILKIHIFHYKNTKNELPFKIHVTCTYGMLQIFHMVALDQTNSHHCYT